jgi:AraC-like DNA-binding protein
MLLRHEGFRRLCHARDLLRDGREPAPTIEQLAREVRISPFHFIRQFEAVFGVTPHQFRIASRIELAKALLAGGEYSVTDVCMEVGFSSPRQLQHALRAARRPIAIAVPTAHSDVGRSAGTTCHSPHAWMLEPDGRAARQRSGPP